MVQLGRMRSTLRPRRDFHGLEVRRRQAARLFGQGENQAAVARRLGVSQQSVSRWHAQWRRGGAAALRAAGRAGRKPRLSAAQLKRVDVALRRGPQAHGFPTSWWTLTRIAIVITRETRVRYHPGHVWKVLRTLHWTLKRPSGLAKKHDVTDLRRWVAGPAPVVKKTPGGGGPRSPSKTKVGFRLVRRSGARGRRRDRPRN